MPVRYVAEMICDRIAACEVYKGKDYTSAALNIMNIQKVYHHPSKDKGAAGKAAHHAEG